jgi:hypothetical protein
VCVIYINCSSTSITAQSWYMNCLKDRMYRNSVARIPQKYTVQICFWSILNLLILNIVDSNKFLGLKKRENYAGSKQPPPTIIKDFYNN